MILFPLFITVMSVLQAYLERRKPRAWRQLRPAPSRRSGTAAGKGSAAALVQQLTLLVQH